MRFGADVELGLYGAGDGLEGRGDWGREGLLQEVLAMGMEKVEGYVWASLCTGYLLTLYPNQEIVSKRPTAPLSISL